MPSGNLSAPGTSPPKGTYGGSTASPRGDRQEDNGNYLSLFLKLERKSKGVKAIFEAFVMDRDGAMSVSHYKRCVQVYPPKESDNSESLSH